MKLYYFPGACSLSPHIVAKEAGLELQLEAVDLKTKRTASGVDYTTINPKGLVPALDLGNGEVLTEGPAIVQYLADQNPASGLAPANGTLARYRLQEMLGFINSEVHKSYSFLINPATPEVVRESRSKLLLKYYALFDKRLATHDWLVGDTFTAADAYLFTATNWAARVKLDLSAFAAVAAFQKRVAARPQVQAAMKEEGLLK